MARPLAPRSQITYGRLLRRAYGTDSPNAFAGMDASVTRWPQNCRALLRHAIKRRCKDLGGHLQSDCPRCAPAVRMIPNTWQARKAVQIPEENEAIAYERAAGELPKGMRALALLPLALGLRAEEVCNLTRENVKRAIKTGELIALRKGGAEKPIPAMGVKALLAELLEIPAARGRAYKPLAAPSPAQIWRRVGEILSPAQYGAQYQKLRKIVRQTGARAGLSGLHPHLLRHAFATRMERDGASLFTIQAALNHANITTTQRYVHPSFADVAARQRNFNQPANARALRVPQSGPSPMDR